MGVKDRPDKDKRIEREIKRIKAFLKDLPDDRVKTVDSLIRNAAFMTITLEDLQQSMVVNGVISEYQNGENQWGTKKSPEVEIYNSMIKNYMALMKQITDLLPALDQAGKQAADELMSFVKAAKAK
jgi:hypothetical protein